MGLFVSDFGFLAPNSRAHTRHVDVHSCTPTPDRNDNNDTIIYIKEIEGDCVRARGISSGGAGVARTRGKLDCRPAGRAAR